MTIRAAIFVRLAAAAGALALGACQDNQSELAKLDNQIIGNDADPALTSALEDQIMVDPALTQQSNQNAVRPPETPTQAQYPLPQGGQQTGQQAGQQTAAQQPGRRSATVQGAGAPARTAGVQADPVEGGIAGCGPDFDYNMAWARRLPAAFPVYPGSRITDAAGADRPECRARVVTFTTADAPQRVLDFYSARAAQAGFSAERQQREGDHILAGTNGGEGAYFLIVTPTRSGSDVAIIAKNAG